MIKHKYFNQIDQLSSPTDENEAQETPCRVSEAELLLSKMSHYCTHFTAMAGGSKCSVRSSEEEQPLTN